MDCSSSKMLQKNSISKKLTAAKATAKHCDLYSILQVYAEFTQLSAGHIRRTIGVNSKHINVSYHMPRDSLRHPSKLGRPPMPSMLVILLLIGLCYMKHDTRLSIHNTLVIIDSSCIHGIELTDKLMAVPH